MRAHFRMAYNIGIQYLRKKNYLRGAIARLFLYISSDQKPLSSLDSFSMADNAQSDRSGWARPDVKSTLNVSLCH